MSVNRVLVLLVLLLASHAGQAAITCRIVTAGSLAFGSYLVIAAPPQDSLLNLTVTCDRHGGRSSVTVTLRLGTGNHASTVTGRRMARGELPLDYLSYGLYRDVSRSSVWGFTDTVDTVSQTLTIPNKESRSATFVVYGRIPAGQDARAGNYSDSVQATIVY